ncbi:MAG TPA: hypothetical protein VNR87_16315 [Flavisolibacter sp.]|nr:hypothetical protein [Flavisolibacter sp.]
MASKLMAGTKPMTSIISYPDKNHNLAKEKPLCVAIADSGCAGRGNAS